MGTGVAVEKGGGRAGAPDLFARVVRAPTDPRRRVARAPRRSVGDGGAPAIGGVAWSRFGTEDTSPVRTENNWLSKREDTLIRYPLPTKVYSTRPLFSDFIKPGVDTLFGREVYLTLKIDPCCWPLSDSGKQENRDDLF